MFNPGPSEGLIPNPNKPAHPRRPVEPPSPADPADAKRSNQKRSRSLRRASARLRQSRSICRPPTGDLADIKGAKTMSVLKKATAAAAGSLFLLGAIAGPSQAANNNTLNDGLVSVTVGDITIEDAVDVNVAASVAATLCDVADIGSIAVLGEAVDATGSEETVCDTATGPVRIINN